MICAPVIVATSGLSVPGLTFYHSGKRLDPSDSFQKCMACLDAGPLLKMAQDKI